MTLFDGTTDVRRVSLVKLSSEIARSLAVVGRVVVEGEVVRPQHHPGGTYFTLKDRAAQLSVRCPANRLARCRTVAGERVAVTGTLTWLSDRGQVQLVAEEVLPVGAGAIAALLAETRGRLRSDGLLDRARRPLPLLPRLIGVVCGTDAAVRADIESVVAARFPGYPIEFVATNVSGPGAADAIAVALRALDRRPEVDVIILARGGGDASQLLPWSDEALCRAVAASATPVVSAIGHEGDRPLCDEVADLRCGTPSLAAAAVVPSLEDLRTRLDRGLVAAGGSMGRRLESSARRLERIAPAPALRAGLTVAAARLDRVAARVALVHPSRRLRSAGERLTAARRAVEHVGPGRLAGPAHGRLTDLRRSLDALDPVRVLDRGYAIVRRDGDVVRTPDAVGDGDELDVQVAGGRFGARAVR